MKRRGWPSGQAQATATLTVVGIGASAGGLKALREFVEAVPADSGLAFVVVVHLDPERPSRMAELLQDRTAMPVSQVDMATKVEANHIYVIPPAHDLAIVGDTLTLRERGERSSHAPVDLLFRTLAEAYGHDAVGVVLSGTGVDGTAGLRHIREGGGITIAQSPEEAEYDGMPSSAIATGLVDLVLSAAHIPGELARLHRHPSGLDAADLPEESDEEGLAHVFDVLRAQTGHDFSLYKRSTVLRRLDRRMRFNGVTTLDEYLPILRSSHTEGQALLRDLLISVSSFFRDPAAFDALDVLLPKLFEGKGPNDSVRVWVVGCATGEEVYSLAMLLSEHAATLLDPPRIQLFATDIDENGYGWARAGLYAAAAVANVKPDRLERFFSKETGGYRVSKTLRELVLFARHNVLQDPPFSRMDLISCRNLFIYLQPEAQGRALETFHFALNPGGMLFLGESETVGDTGLFKPTAGDKHRVFTRNEPPHRGTPRLSAADPRPLGPAPAPEAGGATDKPGGGFSYGALHVRMLEQYAPASAIVDDRLNVVHLSAHAGDFLRPNEGEPSTSILDMTRGDLRRVLRTALHQAIRKGARTSRAVRMELDGRERQVTVQVHPYSENGTESGRFALIFFEPVEEREDGAAEAKQPRMSDLDVEEELRRTTDLLESTSAAHDQTVADLQAANEELLSINEEQKAASEEMEIGREEIQSINEELTTINQEHQGTIEELKRTNADLQNLIESTEIGTIFLDRQMRIRRFTPAVAGIFNFQEADQGRTFSHITHHLNYDGLAGDVARVLESLERMEREVASDTGEWYIVRINPYRSLDGGHDGAVLTFFNNTAQHSVEEELREAKVIAELANLSKSTFLSTLSHEFRTPLNGIIGYADLLESGGGLPGPQAEKVKRIKAGAWHLTAMIDEILSFAKLDGGHEQVEPERLDANALAREAAGLIEPAAAGQGLTMVLDLPEDPVPLVTDGGKARQILINLCGNAVKYTIDGEVRLRVIPGRERVTFEVTDTGVGIAPEHQERVFERFWQLDSALTLAAGGMGIGLAAAREYARLLKGDVEVESEPGNGSTFRLWLPADYGNE
jgi:two-component system CheB/CheR fusion protein